MSTGFVVFGLGERTFATELNDVREIVRLHDLQPLPGARPPLTGVIVLRGAPLPVLDVRGPGARVDRGDVLIMSAGDDLVGVAVDAVRAVLHPDELPESKTRPARVLPAYVVGVRNAADGPVLQVDVRRLLDVLAEGWEAALPAADALPVG
jgi:purine-binding chemotaxis protein CheW